MRVSLGVLSAVLLLAGCATPTARNHTAEAIQREMAQAAQPTEVDNALLPPLAVETPVVEDKPLEPRFDLAVSATPVQQVFMAIVSGTRYSMLLHPEVAGNISLNLKDVTVFEALEAIRDMYGYDYKVSGERIYVQPLTMQTRIFQVNYLTGTREGRSSVRVASGSVADVVSGSNSGTQQASTTRDSTQVSMSSNTDFWEDLAKSLKIIVGSEGGRSVVVNPMSGVLVVRAMPDELKTVAAYLKASQLSIERQVILEAKIIEVQLSDGYQSGVNWGAFNLFKSPGSGALGNIPNSTLTMGQVTPGRTLGTTAAGIKGAVGTTTAQAAAALLNGTTPGSLFGMALQTNNFALLLNFLESQGNVHVLSSPRISTLSNQKAVLKVGTDEFFVTKLTGGSVTAATQTTAGTVTAPTVETTAFFSGIMLDVTPKIDDNNEIVLHIHPSVSQVSTVNKTVSMGAALGVFNLPVPSSSVSETDSIVRARDGQVVVIGGLMRQATYDDQSGLPGMPKQVLGQVNKTSEKRELVILLKPTVVDNDKDWSQDITQSRDRVNGLVGQGGRP